MKILKEETKYHHGSFKDLQTFLDKNGDPYTLIKSQPPQNKSKDNSKSSANQNNSQNQSNQQNNQNQSQNQSKNQSQNQSQNQSRNQSQNQSGNSSQNQSQNDQKVPPDPNASYVDVSTGLEYKWDPKKNQFIRVGKYHAK